jgi:hypothetical protein
MSDTWLVPGGSVVQENNDGADWLIPGSSVVNEASGAPPPTASPTSIFYGPLVGPFGGPI